MTDKAKLTENEDASAEMRGKLVKRLAIAGVLVAILLGVLAFFDYLATPPEDTDVTVFSKPVPVGPKKPLSQPVKPSTELPEPPAPAEAPPTPPAPPAPPVVAETPLPEVKGESRPTAAPKPHSSTAAASVTPPTPAPEPARRMSRQAPEYTAAPTISQSAPPAEPTVASTAAPVGKPSARLIETRSAPPVAPPSGLTRLFSGFLLQAGVFSSPQRAEELHAKLTLSGVPSSLETRVQVGPFRTRQEAEAAQEKLKELGVETVLVAPKPGRH